MGLGLGLFPSHAGPLSSVPCSLSLGTTLINILLTSYSLFPGFQHLCYSQGCWLGDRKNPLCRVWYCGDTKLLSRAEVSGSNPAKLSLNLLEVLFSRDEMAASNINGARGRELLDPIKIKAIQGECKVQCTASVRKVPPFAVTHAFLVSRDGRIQQYFCALYDYAGKADLTMGRVFVRLDSC